MYLHRKHTCSPAACALGGGSKGSSSESASAPLPFLGTVGVGWAAQMRFRHSSAVLPGTCCATLRQKLGAVGSSAMRYALCAISRVPLSSAYQPTHQEQICPLHNMESLSEHHVQTPCIKSASDARQCPGSCTGPPSCSGAAKGISSNHIARLTFETPG